MDNRLARLLALGALGAAPALQAAASAPPQAVDDSINTAEGTPGDTNVLANDFDGSTGTLRIAWLKRPQATATARGRGRRAAAAGHHARTVTRLPACS
jgi:hypothetical protein